MANAIQACLDDDECEYVLDHGCDHTLFQDDTAFGVIKISDSESQDNSGNIYSETNSRHWRLVTSSQISDLKLYPDDDWKSMSRSFPPHCVLMKPSAKPHVEVKTFGLEEYELLSGDDSLNMIFKTNTDETTLSIDDVSVSGGTLASSFMTTDSDGFVLAMRFSDESEFFFDSEYWTNSELLDESDMYVPVFELEARVKYLS